MPPPMLPPARASLMVITMAVGAAGAKNVLFLVSDDMRPQMAGAYGHTFMHTPNLDKLAAESTVFDRHYTNFAICSASRNSFMTGRMPDKTQVWNFITHFRESRWWPADGVTLPQYFKQHGYTTLGAGKLYHPNKPPNNDLPFSWTTERPYYRPYVGGSWPQNCSINDPVTGIPKQSMTCVEPDLAELSPDGTFFDGLRFADYNESIETVTTIKLAAAEYKTSGKPFFIGLGVTKPHANWIIPDYYYQMYTGKSCQLPKHPYSPIGVPDIAFTAEFDGQENLSLAGPGVVPGTPQAAIYKLPTPGNNTFPEWFVRSIRAGYYGAVSLADKHLGFALDALEATGLKHETLTIFSADHGYQLGEHTEYGKHTNFELATHVPLIIRAPWITGSAGRHTSAFTELVDLYRTIVSLAELPPPDNDVDGQDKSILLANPDAVVSNGSFSQYSRCPGDRWWPLRFPGAPGWFMNNCEMVPAENISAMGYSVRTNGWRYTAWFPWDGPRCRAKWDAPLMGRELYAHDDKVTFPIDFDCCENENVVDKVEHFGLVTELHQMILRRYRPGPGSNERGCPIPKDPAPALEQN